MLQGTASSISAPRSTRAGARTRSSTRASETLRSPAEAMPSGADLVRHPLGAVVVGPEIFASALLAQGVPVGRVDWRPSSAPVELGALWCDAVDAANRITLDRILGAHQVLVDVRP